MNPFAEEGAEICHSYLLCICNDCTLIFLLRDVYSWLPLSL